MNNESIPQSLESKSESRLGSTCRWWTASKNHNGYGVLKIHKKVKRAHRIAYELYVGPIPKDLLVLHKCDNRLCINPTHLFLGTNQDNMDDMVRKGRSGKGRQGNQCHPNKLTVERVTRIRQMTGSRKYIANLFGVDVRTIGKVLNRETWRHVT